jgi:hypothetical protein
MRDRELRSVYRILRFYLMHVSLNLSPHVPLPLQDPQPSKYKGLIPVPSLSPATRTTHVPYILSPDRIGSAVRCFPNMEVRIGSAVRCFPNMEVRIGSAVRCFPNMEVRIGSLLP